MIHSFWNRGIFKSAVLACLCAFVGVGAAALDVNDVKNLVRSGVSEDVIINMVRQSTPVAMADTDANELRAMGASENLVAIVRDSYTGGPVYAGSPGEYILSDGSTAPIYSSPEVVYADPNVYYTTPPTVVYEVPTVVTPSYVYPYYPYYPYYPSYSRYRSSPSWGFSINLGGGSHHRDRHHGGPRGGPRGGRGHRR